MTDYLVANFLIRINGERSDVARHYKLAGFRPFEVASDPTAQPLVDLYPEVDLRLEGIEGVEILDHSYIADADAEGYFGRWSGGYLFYMEDKFDNRVIFTKERNTPYVESNVGLNDAMPFVDAMYRFGIWIVFGLAHLAHRTIAIHSSAICYAGRAVLFLGESGTGKSTHTRLWRENIEGAWLLNDDSPIVRIEEGVAYAYGSPWSGKTACYRRERVPIEGVVRLSQAPHNRIRRLTTLEALGAILPSCPPNFAYDEELQDAICQSVSQLLRCVGLFNLECLPDADAARLSYSTVIPHPPQKKDVDHEKSCTE